MKTNATSNATSHAHVQNSQESKFKQLAKSASSYLLRVDEGLARKFSNFTFAKAYAASLEQDVKRFSGCNSTPEFDNYFPTNTATWGVDKDGCAIFHYTMIPGNPWPGGVFCYTSVSLLYMIYCVIGTDPLYVIFDPKTLTYAGTQFPMIPRYFAVTPPGLKCSDMGYHTCELDGVVLGTDVCYGEAGYDFATQCLMTPPNELPPTSVFDPDVCAHFQQRIATYNEGGAGGAFCRTDHHMGFHNFLGPKNH